MSARVCTGCDDARGPHWHHEDGRMSKASAEDVADAARASQAARTLGARGGASGTGASKRRGDAGYYRDLASRRKPR